MYKHWSEIERILFSKDKAFRTDLYNEFAKQSTRWSKQMLSILKDIVVKGYTQAYVTDKSGLHKQAINRAVAKYKVFLSTKKLI